MKLLITGGAGTLGSSLIEHYLPLGHDILVIDNFATGRREVVPQGLKGLVLIEGSICDEDLVKRAFEEFIPTHVIHSAASYKDPNDWREDVATNVMGTVNVVRAAEAAGVARLVNLQTSLCYGRPDAVPIPVDAPLRPFTSYAISKTAGELYTLQSSVPHVSLRLANVTGPRLAIGPIPTFYTRLKAGKACFCSRTVRDFIDMDDFIAVMDLVLADGAPTGIFNVSTGTGHTIKEIFDIIASHLNIVLEAPVPELDPGPDDVAQVILDPSRTIEVLGWRPTLSFEQTLKRMLAWYDDHGVSAIYSHLTVPAKI